MDFLRRNVYMDFFNNLYIPDDDDHHPRMFHEPENPFETLSRAAFTNYYRLTKERVFQVIDICRQYFPAPERRSALGVPRKVLTALQFFGAGSYQTDIGKSIHSATSQPSVSRCINEIINVFNRPEIFNENVYFFRNIEELRASRNRFFEKFEMPYTIGCIDCTHIAIVPPKNNPDNPEQAYVNRKGYHSLNVQLICDADFRIVNVNARYPGSTHDSYIWNNSSVRPVMQRIFNINNEHFYLLGDAGYPLRPWLLTPFQNPVPDSPEEAFNTKLCRARSIIERVNGILKMRFRCLLKQRVLHYAPLTAAKIVNTCAVLHNMAVTDGLVIRAADANEWINNPDYGMDNNVSIDDIHPHVRNVNPELAAGRVLRQQVVQEWFA